MKNIVKWVVARAKEPSTWAAVAAIAGAVGQVHIAAVAGAVAAAIKEGPRTAEASK